jgi:hypothetical protein
VAVHSWGAGGPPGKRRAGSVAARATVGIAKDNCRTLGPGPLSNRRATKAAAGSPNTGTGKAASCSNGAPVTAVHSRSRHGPARAGWAGASSATGTRPPRIGPGGLWKAVSRISQGRNTDASGAGTSRPERTEHCLAPCITRCILTIRLLRWQTRSASLGCRTLASCFVLARVAMDSSVSG